MTMMEKVIVEETNVDGVINPLIQTILGERLMVKGGGVTFPATHPLAVQLALGQTFNDDIYGTLHNGYFRHDYK